MPRESFCESICEMAAVSPAPIKFNSLKQNDAEECFSFESLCVHASGNSFGNSSGNCADFHNSSQISSFMIL